MAVSINEIAKRANLSQSAVSKALRGYKDISPETIKRVGIIAAELGYMPNFPTSYEKLPQESPNGSTCKQKSGTVNLLFFKQTKQLVSGNLFYSALTHSLHDSAEKMGLLVIESYPKNEADFEKIHAASNADGSIILSNIDLLDPSFIFRLKQHSSSKPIVFLSNYIRGYESHFHSVRTDNVSAGYQAARYALEHGCTTVNFVSELEHLSLVEDRTSGYKKAMAEAGLPINILHYETCKETVNNAPFSSDALCITEGITGFVGVGDSVIIRFGEMLKKKGLYDKNKMQLIGIDGVPALKPDDIRNATVCSDFDNMAEISLRVIVKGFDNPNMGVQNSLIYGLIVDKTNF